MLNRLRALRDRILDRPSGPTAAGAAAFWDQAVAAKGPIYWAEHPLVRQYVNTLITGVDWLWPLPALKAGWAYKALDRGLSIGCGTGSLERAVRHLNICRRIEGIDVSAASVRIARAEARKEGLDGITYKVGDCDRLTLPAARYDAVFFHGSLHHISDPDRLLSEVDRALKPHGILYVDEYVGPSRDEWADEHLTHAREEFERVPEELKLWPVNPPLDYSDPSEMIRSSRIRPAIAERFEVLHDKPYWGNLLFPLFCAVDGHAMSEPAQQAMIEGWIEREKELVRAGEYRDPLFSVIVARRKG